MTDDPVVAYLALGANLGDRAGALRAAVAGLAATPGLTVRRASPVYESAAHTLAAAERQPPFLNAVLEVAATLTPAALLARGHALEDAAGRARDGRWTPRPLDVDLLLYGAVTRPPPGLVLPHPRLAERRFVLQPLADLAPNLHVPPPFDDSVAALLARCPDAGSLHRTAHILLAPRAAP